MATDPWNEPWPYIVHNEECQRGWNLYGDKSDDETTGLLCGNDLGGSNVSISLVISNETSKSAWNAIRKTLTEEINAALEKSNEETLKKQKKDM